MKKNIACFLLILCILLMGCEHKLKEEKCEYEYMKSCDLGNYFVVENQQYYISELMENKSVKVLNQALCTSEYEIAFDEYFYDKDTGVVAYKIIISSLNGEKITDEQFDKLLRLHEDGYIYLINERGSRIINDVLVKEGDKIVWYDVILLNAISENDIPSNYNKTEELECVQLFFDSKALGDFVLPNYNFENKKVVFDTSNDSSIVLLEMTSEGMRIVWDIQDVLREFKKMLKELPKGEDPESYNYCIYNSIILRLKDGREINLENYCSNTEINEKNYIGCYSVIFLEKIELNDILSLTIDGKDYNVKVE